MTTEGFGSFDRWGDATALIDEAGGEISYTQLAQRCEAFAKGLGEERQLILLQAANDVDSVVAYLAALRAGHAVILAGDTDNSAYGRILRAFSPSLVCKRGEVTRTGDAPPASLHPDLAVLLPTSGSMGSPKLVRLSHSNLDSNAEAIVDYLGITPQDRAITSLPLYYSYGMSVLNSHLRAGASVILTDMSVTNPDFWSLFRKQRATSIAGVPYSYELFERIGLRDDPPESLRVMTQAGGGLDPELIRTYAAFGAERGVRFYVMYGQTEAAPRMAYLPPDLAAKNADCIGLPIPGGSLSLRDEDGADIAQAEVQGELVYRGPNVMMGYALSQEDLAAGPDVESLRTGDLAVRTKGGLYRIVGRASRLVKIAGLRIGLDDLEAMLAETGRNAHVAGSDAAVSVCVVGDEDTRAVRDLVAQRCGLPIVRVHAFSVSEEPRLPSGKIDYAAILAMGEADASDANSPAGGAIAAAYAEALGIPLPPGEATFVGLGGDSLSYVNASLKLEAMLGVVPVGWEAMPIATLEAMTPAHATVRTSSQPVSSEIVVRVLALGLVMAVHAFDSSWIHGGANVLFVLAGYSLARFHGDSLLRGSIGPPIGGAFYRILAPYLVCVGIVALRAPAYAGSSFLLISPFVAPPDGWLVAYWFIQTLMHALLITCGLFLVPPVRKFAAARPFAFSLLLVAAGVALMNAPLPWHAFGRRVDQVDAWLYAYYLGWAGYAARLAWQKGLVVVLALVLTGLQYGAPSSREIYVTLGLAIVLFAPDLRLPRWLAGNILKLAAASYFIYLTHAYVWHLMSLHAAGLRMPLARVGLMWLGAVASGLAFAWAWNFVVPKIRLQALQALVTFRARRERIA